MQRITAFTDGASKGNPGPSGWACLIEGKLTSGRVALATNNQMEMFAILKAIESMPFGAAEFHVVSDSKIALGMVVKGWKGKNEVLQALRDQIRHAALIRCLWITGELVKGHAGHRENTLVDQAASLAAKQEQSAQLAR